ncbi:MAG: hypothetical protein IPK32_06210 [Verrucomicrobiaceae bacterium]|nr:hypothetical protein [Verrucomicrobiaceae bacterium]
MKFTFLLIYLIFFTSLARADEVRLTEQDAYAVIDNGLLSVTLHKASATLSSMKYRGMEMIDQSGRRQNVYFSMDGTTRYRQPKNAVFTVQHSTAEMVDVSCHNAWKGKAQALDIEIHFVLRRGDTGLYAYAILDHPATYPETECSEWRMVWRTPPETHDWICVDALRHWRMPDPADYLTAEKTPIKEILKLTQGPRAGHYDCKYDFNASYHELGCWGHAYAEKKTGAWIVCGGYDFFNDGPTKRDLNAAAHVNHIHFGMNHYEASRIKVKAGEKWSKIFGPYLLYCNTAVDVPAMWADARERVKKEKAQWPYAWLTDQPQYPAAKDRGEVTGRLIIQDAQKPQLTAANAWIGLAQPEPEGNWQLESRHYQYWTRADAEGRFTLPSIRPGKHTLYAYTAGAVGEFTKANIEVTAGETTTLGDLTWQVPHHGKLVWEIGVPDRTAAEFAHGDVYFQGFLWQRFSNAFPNPLDFTIGQSTAAKDWNYAQCGYGKDKLQPWPWRIHFQLDAAPKKDAVLTLAIASAHGARIDLHLNDDKKPLTTVRPTQHGGNALIRQSILAKYSVEHVRIPAAKLRAGKNTLTLTQTNVKGPDRHVMYDYLSLELE